MSASLLPVATLAIAFAIDARFGDPPNRWHPVAWLGTLTATARRRLAHGSPAWLVARGALVTIAIGGIAGLVGIVVARGAAHLGTIGIVVEALALSCCLSVRGLWRAAREVASHLETRDLAGARKALSWHLVSRPTDDLGDGEVAAATVESVAENLTDSIVAPARMFRAAPAT